MRELNPPDRVPQPSRFRIVAAALAIGLSSFGLAGCLSVGETPIASATSGSPGPQGPKGPDGAALWLIPSPIPGLNMRATLVVPQGAGPFPLAVIAHGSEQDANRRALQPMPAFPALTDWFLKHNYAVLIPERPGHGKTGGRYLEDQGPCDSADFVAAGNGAADSIAAAITYMAGQAQIRRDGVVVAGNSAGGWGALALAARNPPSVRAIIDFSGGRGGRDRDRAGQNCLPERLVAAAGTFGKTARIPTLWLYAANDTYFPPDLSGRMAAAFRDAGGRVDYRLLPAIAGEGHGLIMTPGPWVPYVEAFLRGIR